MKELFGELPTKLYNGLVRNNLYDVEKLANATDYDLSKIGHDFMTYKEMQAKAKAFIRYIKE